jgi:Tol biopolymer transport system component
VSSLAAGTRVGPYVIESLLGAGGMAEVYRARDTRLSRIVAIKILRARSAGPQDRQRFADEARAISALMHPNVRMLFDVGSEDGLDYLVMEYVDGETLEARLARRAVTLDRALLHARSIAEALDAAHRQGIIHRDVKPSNVLLTTNGGLKLLDFGVAKLCTDLEPPPAPEDTTITQANSIPGTTAYMAPEQLDGQEGDVRSDVYGCGAVLYEMLTGRKPFEAPNRARLIAAVLKDDPAPPSLLNDRVTPALDRAVMMCLAKDPDDRWQSARDLARELDWIASEAGRPVPPAAWTRRLWVPAAALVAGVLAVVLWGRAARESPALPEVRFGVQAAGGFSIVVSPASFALSPDGRHIAFIAAAGNGTRMLWVRALDEYDARLIPGTEDAWNPFWSPDSREVAFRATGRLRRVDIASGDTQTIATLTTGDPFYGSWGSRGDILISADSGVFRIPAAGGTPALIMRNGPDVDYSSPEFLPDGRRYLLHVHSTAPNTTGVYVASLDSAERTRVLDSDSQAVYVEPGYLLHAKGSTLLAQPIDRTTLVPRGEARRLAEIVQLMGSSRRAGFSASRTGALAYRAGLIPSQLAWMDRDGRRLATVAAPGPYLNPALSPDGTRIAVTRFDPAVGTSNLWLFDANGGLTQLTSHPAVDDFALWSRDGSHLLFASNRTGRLALYRKSATAAAAADDEAVLAGGDNRMPLDWSRDGRFLLYLGFGNLGMLGGRFWAVPLDTPAAPFPVPEQRPDKDEGPAEISPDGRWLAYVFDVNGSPQVFVRGFPNGSERWLISSAGGFEPHWRDDGRELFYLAPDGTLMAAAVETAGARVIAAAARPLFRTNLVGAYLGSPFPNGRVRNEYQVAPGGGRFLLNDPEGGSTAFAVRVLLHWNALRTPP